MPALTPEQEMLKQAALATDGAKWETEGFEQIIGNGTFYGGLIMHENGHTIIAQQVLSPYAEFIAAANPAAILAILARLEAALAGTDKLLTIIASAYQIAGAHDSPAHILDVLADPEQATAEQVDAMLPYQPGLVQAVQTVPDGMALAPIEMLRSTYLAIWWAEKLAENRGLHTNSHERGRYRKALREIKKGRALSTMGAAPGEPGQ